MKILCLGCLLGLFCVAASAEENLRFCDDLFYFGDFELARTKAPNKKIAIEKVSEILSEKIATAKLQCEDNGGKFYSCNTHYHIRSNHGRYEIQGTVRVKCDEVSP